jgi:hypothetical protein
MPIPAQTLGGGVKLVQRGKVTVTASSTVNVTVAAVNMNKSFVIDNVRNVTSSLGATVELTSSTNIAIQAGSNDVVVSWQLVEFN